MRAAYRALLASAALTFALAIQLSILPHLALPHAVPDLVLLTVLALAAEWGPNQGTLVGFCAGLALDLVPPSVTAAGRHAFVLTLVGALAGRAAVEARRSAVRTSLLAGAYAGAATLANAALGSLVAAGGTLTSPGLLRGVGACALYTAVATPLVLPGLSALARRHEGRRSAILAPAGNALDQPQASARTVAEL